MQNSSRKCQLFYFHDFVAVFNYSMKIISIKIFQEYFANLYQAAFNMDTLNSKVTFCLCLPFIRKEALEICRN